MESAPVAASKLTIQRGGGSAEKACRRPLSRLSFLSNESR